MSSRDDGIEAPPPSGDRRGLPRYDVLWPVDCATEGTFLYASISNISELGIFVSTTLPLELGTRVTLRFSPQKGEGGGEFALHGVVQWINPVRLLGDNRNPGMGVRFVDLTRADRERLIEVIHTIAYLRDQKN